MARKTRAAENLGLTTEERPLLLFLYLDDQAASFRFKGEAENRCRSTPVVGYNDNKFANREGNCATRRMIQRTKISGSKTCPGCGNGHVCMCVHSMRLIYMILSVKTISCASRSSWNCDW